MSHISQNQSAQSDDVTAKRRRKDSDTDDDIVIPSLAVEVGIEGSGHKKKDIIEKSRWTFNALEKTLMVKMCVKHNFRPCRNLSPDRKMDKNILLNALLGELNYTGAHVRKAAVLNDQEIERLKASLWNAMLHPKFQHMLEKEGLASPVEHAVQLTWSQLEHDIEIALQQDPRRLFKIIGNKISPTLPVDAEDLVSQ
ncbi:hypothetical protein ABW21_db0203802 [Orbilia brochopaga]|nr:hypothetical protein ABW21_db0203802 [Drechslerella brochopaga]